MDPVSLSANLAALLGLTNSIISTGYKMIQEVRDFEADHLSLINEVAQLSGILHTLQPYAEAPHSGALPFGLGGRKGRELVNCFFNIR